MRTILSISALFSLLVIVPVSYMTFDTDPPYVYEPAPSSYVIPHQTQAGHQITVHWKLVRVNRVCVGLITRYIVDKHTGVRVTYDPVPAAGALETTDTSLDRTFFLPQGIAPGPKLYFADGIYGCNLLQRYWKPLVVRTPTLEFDILSPTQEHL